MGIKTIADGGVFRQHGYTYNTYGKLGHDGLILLRSQQFGFTKVFQLRVDGAQRAIRSSFVHVTGSFGMLWSNLIYISLWCVRRVEVGFLGCLMAKAGDEILWCTVDKPSSMTSSFVDGCANWSIARVQS